MISFSFYSQEETLSELQELASKLPWTNALEVWKLNRAVKKRKAHRKGESSSSSSKGPPDHEDKDTTLANTEPMEAPQEESSAEGQTEGSPDTDPAALNSDDAATKARTLKFRVTCNRAGDKHSFSSNDAARDFGGAVQEFFQWKADMTKFDIEVGKSCSDENDSKKTPRVTQKRKT